MDIIKRNSPEKNAKLYSNSILAPMRRKIIKAYFRNLRVAEMFNMSKDEFFTMFFETSAHCMSHDRFCKYMINDSNFRDDTLDTWAKLKESE